MREIKFRAWDKSRKLMIDDVVVIDLYNECIGYLCASSVVQGEIVSRLPINEAILIQSTGLKDRQGVEIFEGDICNCREYECFGKVEWNNEKAGLYFCVVVEGGGFEEEHLYDYTDELEVVGNIYENQELLEER